MSHSKEELIQAEQFLMRNFHKLHTIPEANPAFRTNFMENGQVKYTATGNTILESYLNLQKQVEINYKDRVFSIDEFASAETFIFNKAEESK